MGCSDLLWLVTWRMCVAWQPCSHGSVGNIGGGGTLEDSHVPSIGKGELREEGKYNNHGGQHCLCFDQGCVVEQVLGLVTAVCVLPCGFDGHRVSNLMLYSDVGTAVDEEAGHHVLIPT